MVLGVIKLWSATPSCTVNYSLGNNEVFLRLETFWCVRDAYGIVYFWSCKVFKAGLENQFQVAVFYTAFSIWDFLLHVTFYVLCKCLPVYNSVPNVQQLSIMSLFCWWKGLHKQVVLSDLFIVGFQVTCKCDICGLEFSGQVVLDTHLAGAKHAKKVLWGEVLNRCLCHRDTNIVFRLQHWRTV